MTAELGYLKDNVNQLDSVIDIMLTPYIEFIDQRQQMRRLDQRLEKVVIIEYEFDDEQKSFSYELPVLDLAEDFTTALKNYVDNLSKRHVLIKEESDSLLAELRLQNILVEKEQKLQNLANRILEIFTDESATSGYNKYHKRYRGPIVRFVNKSLANYTKLDGEQKLEQVDNLISCLEEFPDLYFEFNRILEREKEVERLYTKRVFNPYTYVYQDDISFPRFFNAYKEILLPHYKKELEEQIDCDTLFEYKGLLEELFKFMQTSFGEEARQMERRISRNDDAESLIQKFDAPKL
ncbi:MAG: hypothetical protein LAT68_13925 [Cyclobacteriaceae bacterium]|nr:hypothetical protein [Cyclobacteriaceae bacterium]MCH8517418.1 hypothetical protein [Cyclobacteriaceae bacterium]